MIIDTHKKDELFKNQMLLWILSDEAVTLPKPLVKAIQYFIFFSSTEATGFDQFDLLVICGPYNWQICVLMVDKSFLDTKFYEHGWGKHNFYEKKYNLALNDDLFPFQTDGGTSSYETDQIWLGGEYDFSAMKWKWSDSGEAIPILNSAVSGEFENWRAVLYADPPASNKGCLGMQVNLVDFGGWMKYACHVTWYYICEKDL